MAPDIPDNVIPERVGRIFIENPPLLVMNNVIRLLNRSIPVQRIFPDRVFYVRTCDVQPVMAAAEGHWASNAASAGASDFIRSNIRLRTAGSVIR